MAKEENTKQSLRGSEAVESLEVEEGKKGGGESKRAEEEVKGKEEGGSRGTGGWAEMKA